MKRFRIVMLLTDGFGGFGGIAKFNRDLLTALDESDLVESVLAVPRLITEPIEELIPEYVVYNRKAARSKAAFLLQVAKLSAGPGLSRARADLVICGHIHLLPFAWAISTARRARLFLVIHGVEAFEPSRHALANWCSKASDGVISVSQYTFQRYSTWAKHSGPPAFILPNCVDLSSFRPAPPTPALLQRYGLEGSKVLLTVGRLAAEEKYKGFDEVIETIPALSQRFDVKYLIVGDGPDRIRLEQKAQKFGVADRVVFAGRIPEAEKTAHYNLADAYVMPSSGEGFGIVLLEAAACGIPVIGSKSDGSREALCGGGLGTLVDPKAPQEIIDTVAGILKGPSVRKRKPEVELFSRARFSSNVHLWLESVSHRQRLGKAPGKAQNSDGLPPHKESRSA